MDIRMKKFVAKAILGLIFGFVVFTSFTDKKVVKDEPVAVKWYSFEDAIELNKEEPRKIVIDIYTTWCGPCKIMDKKVFGDEAIAKYMNENFYPVKFDGEYKEEIEFEGETYKFIKGKRGNGIHELTLALTNNSPSYPTVVFMDEELEIINSVIGVQPKDMFEMYLEYLYTDSYETQEWFDYSGQR